MKNLTFESKTQWESLPIDQREKLVFFGMIRWYILPYYYAFDPDKWDNKTEENDFELYVRAKYPIQYFFREGYQEIFPIKHITDFHRVCKRVNNHINNFLFPRQIWLTKEIPNSWCDKTELIPKIIFACVVHFVEQEKCFDVIDWPATPEHQHAADTIKAAYHFITVVKPLLEHKIDKCYDTKDYVEIRNIELQIEESTEFHLIEIIKIRNYMWT